MVVITSSLTGVDNAQTVSVALANVTDASGNSSATVSATMEVLIGDVNASKGATATMFRSWSRKRQTAGSTNFQTDVNTSQTKSRSGQLTSEDNFRSDVNLDGRINVGDTNFVKAHAGSARPAPAPAVRRLHTTAGK